jgi:hypothetical protein
MSNRANKTHPECRSDEVFITNSDIETYSEIGWKSKRKGNVAYGTDGKPLGNRWLGAFPVFAKKDEIRQRDPEILKKMEA